MSSVNVSRFYVSHYNRKSMIFFVLHPITDSTICLSFLLIRAIENAPAIDVALSQTASWKSTSDYTVVHYPQIRRSENDRTTVMTIIIVQQATGPQSEYDVYTNLRGSPYTRRRMRMGIRSTWAHTDTARRRCTRVGHTSEM